MDYKNITKELEEIRDLTSLIIFELEEEIELRYYRNLIFLLYKIVNLEIEIKEFIKNRS